MHIPRLNVSSRPISISRANFHNFHQFITLLPISTISTIFIFYPNFESLFLTSTSSAMFLSSLEYTCVLAICSKVAPITRFNQRSVHRIRGNRCQHHPNPFPQRSSLSFLIGSLLVTTASQVDLSLFYQRLTRFVSFTLIYLFFLHPVSLLILRRLEKGRRNGEGSFFASIFFFFFLFEVEERFVNEDR